MKHTEWKQYMHESAERCRRQIAVEIRARSLAQSHPRIDTCDFATIEARICAAMDLAGHTREMGWFENAIRRGCMDELP